MAQKWPAGGILVNEGMNGITDAHIFVWRELIFVYKFQIKLTLSVVIDAILAFFNHPVARKDLKFKRTKRPFALLTDRCANRLKAFDLHREDCSRN